MDIARPSNARQKRIRQALYAVTGLVLVGLITLGLSRLKPAAPSVDGATVWRDTVKRGPMLRQVRGLGTLVPEDIRWIPVDDAGTGRTHHSAARHIGQSRRRDPRAHQPTARTGAARRRAESKASEATQASLRVQLLNDQLQQRASSATIEAEYNKAKTTFEMKEAAGEGPAGVGPRAEAGEGGCRAARHPRRHCQAAAGQRRGIDAGKARRAAVRPRSGAGGAPTEAAPVRRVEGARGVLRHAAAGAGRGRAAGRTRREPGASRQSGPSQGRAQDRRDAGQGHPDRSGRVDDTRNGVVDGRVIRIDPSVQNGTRTVDVSLPATCQRAPCRT